MLMELVKQRDEDSDNSARLVDFHCEVFDGVLMMLSLLLLRTGFS
jgi:hypothetical protein